MKKSKLTIILLILLVSSPVLAATYISSKDIKYTTEFNNDVTNVSEALDDLIQSVDSIKGYGDAEANHILEGKTAVIDGKKVTGTIPSLGEKSITPGQTNMIIQAGQYLAGDQTIIGDANLVSDNIAAGKSIFGVSGTYTNDANATAGDIVNGKTAYIKGQKITGTRTAQNNSYGVKKYDFGQLGGGQACSFSYNFTPTVAGKLIVYMTATRSQSGVNSAWGTKFVKVANNNINSTGGSVDAWAGKYYWVTNVSANQAVNISTSIAGVGTSLTSCSLFVMYVQ